MLKPNQDPMGRALLDALDSCAKSLIIERDDGFFESDNSPAHYLAPYEHWDERDRTAMAWVRRRVLDIGVGGGRHALYLQERGYEVLGIDASPGAVETCRRRGLRDARLMPARAVGPKLGTFDTIIMMGNNFGLLQNRDRACRLLGRLARMTPGDGRIVAATLNVYGTNDPDHLAYHARNRQRGRMAGQLRLRLRYRKLRSPWFDYLMVSPEEMREIVGQTPWHVNELIGDPSGGMYIAILGKGE